MKQFRRFFFFIIPLFALLVLRHHSPSIGEELYALLPMPAISSMKKIMVFAPHPDDETLACGGLIAEARREGIPVKVVVVTNGESFSYAAHIQYKKLALPPAYYIKFGEKRQEETLSAMKLLGVPQEDVIFLGYPDSDLHLLWEKYWGYQQLYTHSLLRTRFSPFQNIFHKNAPYCGASVLEDIKTVIKKYEPTHIFIPSAEDAHPTHWAVNCFCVMALEELKKSGYNPKVYTYIVHRGKFPNPRGLHLDEKLTPPLPLLGVGISWRTLPIPDDLEEKKYEAIEQYKSQLLRRSKFFLFAFARKNELFADEKEALSVPSVKHGRIKIDGREDDWIGIQPFLIDPQNDAFIRRIEASADITYIYLCRDEENLYIMLKTRGGISREIKYYIHILGTEENKEERLRITKEVKPTNSEDCIETAISLSALGSNSSIFIGASTRYGGITIDKTAYRVAILD